MQIWPRNTETERSNVNHIVDMINIVTFDYINRVNLTLPFLVYEGTWTSLSPPVAMHHHDLACA